MDLEALDSAVTGGQSRQFKPDSQRFTTGRVPMQLAVPPSVPPEATGDRPAFVPGSQASHGQPDQVNSTMRVSQEAPKAAVADPKRRKLGAEAAGGEIPRGQGQPLGLPAAGAARADSKKPSWSQESALRIAATSRGVRLRPAGMLLSAACRKL